MMQQRRTGSNPPWYLSRHAIAVLIITYATIVAYTIAEVHLG